MRHWLMASALLLAAPVLRAESTTPAVIELPTAKFALGDDPAREGICARRHRLLCDGVEQLRDAGLARVRRVLHFQALQAAGKVDRQAVRDALANIPKYDGVTGTMQFKEGSGDPIKSAVILQIKNGAFVFFANANP